MDGIFSEEGLKIYYQKIGNDKTFLVFSEKQNPSNCSCGHLECSLHTAAGKRSSKLWKKFRSESEILETCLTFSKLIASKSFSELKTCSFNKPAVIFLPEVKRNITQNPKKFQADIEDVPVETPIAVWKILPKNFRRKPSAENFLPTSKNHRSISWKCQ